MTGIFKIIGYVALSVAILFLAILVYRGVSAREMSDLQAWHDMPQLEDPLIRVSYEDFSEYLSAERRFLDDIQDHVSTNERSSYNRYARNNDSSPYVDGENLNASFEFLPDGEVVKGGILLVHGLTDSPYHLRAIGRFFSDNGFYVIGLRLPGHGTVPGGLLGVTWQDWYSAVKFGARMVLKKLGNRNESMFYVGGFSTGGALTLRYFLEASSEQLEVPSVENHRVPDKLLLLSPAIGIDPFAEVLDWHQIISWMPYFKKFKWLDIKPEYDPFKYNSFTKNAGNQIYELTKENEKLIEEIARDKATRDKLNPIYAFQSRVDATVKTDKLLEMFEKIASRESELLLFDINRLAETLVSEDVKKDSLLNSAKIKNLSAKLWVVSNKPSADGQAYESQIAVNTYSRLTENVSDAGSEFDGLNRLEWPEDVFALSHVCIPISPDDPFYGRKSKLGGINAKGEKKVLLIGDDLARLRYNPFFELIEKRLLVSFVGEAEDQMTAKPD